MRRVPVSLLTVLLVAVLGLVAVPAPPAHAADGWVELSGRVVDAKGQGIRHVRIEVHDPVQPDPDFYRFGALTDESGEWSLRTGSGTYYLEADDPFYLNEFVTGFYPDTQERAEAQLVTFEPDEVRRFDFSLQSVFDAGPPATALDTSSRGAVAEAYRTQVGSALEVENPPRPGDQPFTCKPLVDAASMRATLSATNFVRSLAQTDPVTFDADQSARTAYWTMVQDLNQTLDADSRDRVVDCYDEKRLAQSEASASTDRGPAARGVVAIMSDHARSQPGFESVPAGTDLLEPRLVGIGAGSSGRYTALDFANPRTTPDAYPSGTRPGPPGLPLRTWPTPGYVPQTMVPARWTVALNNYSYDLSQAVVEVQRVDVPGQPAIRVVPSVRNIRTLVWTPPGMVSPGRTGSVDYRVTLDKVRYRGTWAPTTSYTVRLFDPRGQLTVRTPVALSGRARVGSVLTATVRWQQPGVATHHTWLRDGRTITRATGRSYTPSAADVGHRLSVRATGTRAGDLGASSVSARTAVVTRKPATITIKATGGERRVALRATVAAPDETIKGTLHVLENGRRKATATVRGGVGTVHLAKVTKGLHIYRVDFLGTDRVQKASRSVQVRVR